MQRASSSNCFVVKLRKVLTTRRFRSFSRYLDPTFHWAISVTLLKWEITSLTGSSESLSLLRMSSKLQGTVTPCTWCSWIMRKSNSGPVTFSRSDHLILVHKSDWISSHRKVSNLSRFCLSKEQTWRQLSIVVPNVVVLCTPSSWHSWTRPWTSNFERLLILAGGIALDKSHPFRFKLKWQSPCWCWPSQHDCWLVLDPNIIDTIKMIRLLNPFLTTSLSTLLELELGWSNGFDRERLGQWFEVWPSFPSISITMRLLNSANLWMYRIRLWCWCCCCCHQWLQHCNEFLELSCCEYWRCWTTRWWWYICCHLKVVPGKWCKLDLM